MIYAMDGIQPMTIDLKKVLEKHNLADRRQRATLVPGYRVMHVETQTPIHCRSLERGIAHPEIVVS